MCRKPQQGSIEVVMGLDGLAHLVAQTYSLNSLRRIIPGEYGYSIKNWVHDYLEDLAERGEGNAIREFLLLFPNIDPLAKRLGVKVRDVPYDRKPSEVLDRLRISEYRVPRGILSELELIKKAEAELDKLSRPRDLLSLGVDTCESFEYILKMMIVFYGSFCFEPVFRGYFERVDTDKDVDKVVEHLSPQADSGVDGLFSSASSGESHKVDLSSIEDQSLRDSLKHFFEKRMSVDMGKRISILERLNDYSARLDRFLIAFGRQYIFAKPLIDQLVKSKSSRKPNRIRERTDAFEEYSAESLKELLHEIRELRNPLPHDKDGNPGTEILRTTEGMREHLGRLFRAIQRLKLIGGEISLFPVAGRLVHKFEKLNLGPRLELVSEQGNSIFVPREDLSGYKVGAEYFCWKPSALDRWSSDSIVVLKKLR